jgi:hypothetical protein
VIRFNSDQIAIDPDPSGYLITAVRRGIKTGSRIQLDGEEFRVERVEYYKGWGGVFQALVKAV